MKILRHAESKGGKWGIELQDKGTYFSVVQTKNGNEYSHSTLNDINDADRQYFYQIGLALIIDGITFSEK